MAESALLDRTSDPITPGEIPVLIKNPPVDLVVAGARVENWTLAGRSAGEMPLSPTIEDDREVLPPVPNGCTMLRVPKFSEVARR